VARRAIFAPQQAHRVGSLGGEAASSRQEASAAFLVPSATSVDASSCSTSNLDSAEQRFGSIMLAGQHVSVTRGRPDGEQDWSTWQKPDQLAVLP
tara:strand:- start:72 stop:356 length:285 start_codon:yes stop_codon:yes gene_type:complete